MIKTLTTSQKLVRDAVGPLELSLFSKDVQEDICSLGNSHYCGTDRTYRDYLGCDAFRDELKERLELNRDKSVGQIEALKLLETFDVWTCGGFRYNDTTVEVYPDGSYVAGDLTGCIMYGNLFENFMFDHHAWEMHEVADKRERGEELDVEEANFLDFLENRGYKFVYHEPIRWTYFPDDYQVIEERYN